MILLLQPQLDSLIGTIGGCKHELGPAQPGTASRST